MQCPVCHAEASKGASFCQHCGAKLPLMPAGTGQPAQTTAAASPPPQQSAAAAIESSAPSTPGAAAIRGRRGPTPDVPEEVLWEGSYSPKAMLGPTVACVVATAAIMIVGGIYVGWFWPFILVVVLWLILLGQLAVRRLGVSYKLTNQMFYHRTGIFTRTTDRIECIDIDDVTWKQGLFERLVNVGSVKISSSDKTDPVFWAPGIDNVEQVAHLIDKARRAERLRRGVSVEAV